MARSTDYGAFSMREEAASAIRRADDAGDTSSSTIAADCRSGRGRGTAAFVTVAGALALVMSRHALQTGAAQSATEATPQMVKTTKATTRAAATTRVAATKAAAMSASDLHLLYYKHARLSTDPQSECSWMRDVLGLDATFSNYTMDDAGTSGACALVCEASTVNGVALTDTQTWGTNAGSMKPSSWIEYWLSLHGVLGGTEYADEGWSQFMHMAVAYWTPSLSDGVLDTLEAQGVNHLKRKYTSAADGLDMCVAVVCPSALVGRCLGSRRSSWATRCSRGSCDAVSVRRRGRSLRSDAPTRRLTSRFKSPPLPPGTW